MAPLLFFLLLHVSSANPVAPTTTWFLHSSCTATLYPRLCLRSLSPYASVIGSDRTRLAAVATNVTLRHVRSTSTLLSSASSTTSVGTRSAGALRDCVETFGDAADLVEQSLGELEALLSPEGAARYSWHIGNAQTWMSAALTDEDTCVDGFEPLAGGKEGDVAAEVTARVKGVERYTSNALALVNKLVSHRRR